uniref:Dynein light intermediate chain n=1 Tax=Rhabditophanes sp. KR3021 TaxID=114890 RepID=A0AC35TFK0_9BILA
MILKSRLASKAVNSPVSVADKLQNCVTNAQMRYEDVMGMTTIKKIQEDVIQCEERLNAAQIKRQSLQQGLTELRRQLKEIALKMERTPRSDDGYLKLVTLEHGILKQETPLEAEFDLSAEAERSAFQELSIKVRHAHEKERERIEKTRFFSLGCAVFGAGVTMLSSLLNDMLKNRRFHLVYNDTVDLKVMLKEAIAELNAKQLVFEEAVKAIQQGDTTKIDQLVASLGNQRGHVQTFSNDNLDGNSRTGKSSLIKGLTKHERICDYGAALEFDFMTVQQDFRESSYSYRTMSAATALSLPDSLNLPIYTLDGDDCYSEVLQTAFIPTLSKTVVMLCASWEDPENMLGELKKWYAVVSDAFKTHYSKEDLVEAQKMQCRMWQEYDEPREENLDNEKGHDDEIIFDLPNNILLENCGSSVIVVLTKVDTQSELSNEKMDKIQYQIRKYCMSIGAALFYTSTGDKEKEQIQYLGKYLVHRAYNLPFFRVPNVTDRDSVLIPAGWDDAAKLEILGETMSNPDEPVQSGNDYQAKMKTREPPIVEVEEEQDFLKRIDAIEPQQSNKIARGTMDPTESQPPSNSLLASFFNNLIKQPKDEKSSAMTNGLTNGSVNEAPQPPPACS